MKQVADVYDAIDSNVYEVGIYSVNFPNEKPNELPVAPIIVQVLSVFKIVLVLVFQIWIPILLVLCNG